MKAFRTIALGVALATVVGIAAVLLLRPDVVAKLGQRGGDEPVPENAIRVLFIGNSFTYYHDMPVLVKRLAEANGEPRPFAPVQETPGGFSFQAHCEKGTAFAKIGSQPWDYVVLQEQSVRPSLGREQRAREINPYAQQLVAAIRQTTAKPLLYETWGHRHGNRNRPGDRFADMQQRLREGYEELGKELSVDIVPVGDAWEAALEKRPRLELWEGDNYHPSLRGSYLAACVFYGAFYNHTPVDNEFLAGLDADEARVLQQAAEETLQKQKNRP